MSSRNHMLAALAIMLTAISAGFVFLVWPNYREAAAVERKIKDLRAKMAGLHGRTQEVDKLAAESSVASDRIANDLKSIPDSPDIAGLIRKLSLEVDRTTVMDQTFTAGSACAAIIGSKEPTQAMPLTVDMEATFDSVFALLRNAESIQRLVRVTSVRVACKRDEKDKHPTDIPMVKASIGLEAIYEPVVPEAH